MNCPRCQGLLVTETYFDGDEPGDRWTVAHCVNCAFYTDQLMELNRMATNSSLRVWTSPRMPGGIRC